MVNQRNFNRIYIKRRSLPEWMALYLFLYPFIIAVLLDVFNLPSFVKYTADVTWVAVLAIMIFERKFLFLKKITPLVFLVAAWLILCGIVYFLNFQSIFYFLWGLRNTFRYFVAFFAYTVFFDEGDAKSCLKFMDVIFWINAIVTCIQFFFLGYKQDFLGGIFGVEYGCNGYSIALFLIVLAKSLILCMERKETALSCCLKCGAALIIAALAELKAFFLFFVCILVLSMFLTKFSWKKMLIVVFSIVFISVATSLWAILFSADADTLTFEAIVELITAKNYASHEDLGRFSAIPTVLERFLPTFFDKMFGMGLGNCDASSFKMCRTPFFETYGHLHYNWFLGAFLILETGLIGFSLYMLFFVYVFVLAYKKLKRAEGNKLFSQLAVIFAVVCFILTFYNATLRREFGYVLYFVLALPFIPTKSIQGVDRAGTPENNKVAGE